MPFVLCIITISDDEKVFLEDVRGLALLAHHIGVIAAAHKLVKDLEFGLAESAENLNGLSMTSKAILRLVSSFRRLGLTYKSNFLQTFNIFTFVVEFMICCNIMLDDLKSLLGIVIIM